MFVLPLSNIQQGQHQGIWLLDSLRELFKGPAHLPGGSRSLS